MESTSLKTALVDKNDYASLNSISQHRDGDVVLVEDDKEGHEKSPFWYAVVHLATMMIGPVLLALPHAYANLSLFGGVFTQIAFALIALLNTRLLSALWLRLTSKETPGSPPLDYYDMAQKVGGLRLKSFVSFLQMVTLLGTAVGQIIAAGQTMYLFAPALDSIWFTLIAGCLCVLIGLSPGYHNFIFASIIGLTGTISSASIIIVVSLLEPTYVPPILPKEDYPWISFLKGMSIIVFTYAGASVQPSVQASLQKPNSFFGAYSMAWFYTFCVTLPAGVVSVIHFGSAIKGNIYYTLNDGLGPSAKASSGLGVALRVGEFAMTIHTLVAYGIYIMPVMNAAERSFVNNKNSSAGTKKTLVRVCISLCLVFVAVAMPFFSDIQALIGATTSSLLSFICPCAFYLKVNWNDLGVWHKWCFVSFLVAVFLISFVGGTVASAWSLVQSASEYSLFPLCYQCNSTR